MNERLCVTANPHEKSSSIMLLSGLSSDGQGQQTLLPH
jgi:hypothetical protein